MAPKVKAIFCHFLSFSAPAGHFEEAMPGAHIGRRPQNWAALGRPMCGPSTCGAAFPMDSNTARTHGARLGHFSNEPFCAQCGLKPIWRVCAHAGFDPTAPIAPRAQSTHPCGSRTARDLVHIKPLRSNGLPNMARGSPKTMKMATIAGLHRPKRALGAPLSAPHARPVAKARPRARQGGRVGASPPPHPPLPPSWPKVASSRFGGCVATHGGPGPPEPREILGF